MSSKNKIRLDSVEIDFDCKYKTVRIFDWGSMESIEFYADEWADIKSAVDKIIRNPASDKRQPIKSQTIDETSGLRLGGVDVLTNDNGSVVFYADRLVVKNMLTGEVRDFTPKADENPEQ